MDLHWTLSALKLGIDRNEWRKVITEKEVLSKILIR